MTAAITIRTASREDTRRITEIENLCFGAERFTARQVAYLVSRARGWLFVAETGGETAAYISLLAHSRRNGLRIYSLAVDPRFRGLGAGAALIEKAIETASKNGFSYISLEVRAGNEAAVNLYRKYGFEVSSIIAGYYPDGEDACAMRLSVNPPA